MKNLLRIAALIGIIAGIGTSYVALASASTLKVVQTPTVHLYTGQSTSATTMRITPYPKDLDGTKLTISDFGDSPTLTVDPKISSSEEIESFTAITDNGDGTATLSGMTRDLISKYPYTTAGTGRSHGSGATVVFGNNPQIYGRLAGKENNETITGTWTYNTRPNIPSDTDTANATDFITFGQLSRQAIAGASNAAEGVKGLVQLATGLQLASTTSAGSTGARLALPSSLATSTPGSNATTTIAVTQTNGKLNQLFWDFTQLFTFTGGVTSTGTTTISASSLVTNPLVLNTLAYKFPSSRGASNTVLTEDGSGTLSWTPSGHITSASTTPTLTKSNGYATSSPFMTIAAGTLSASSTIDIYGDFSCVQANTTITTCHVYLGDNLGNKYADMSITFNTNNNQTIDCGFHAQILFNNSLSSQITLTQTSGGDQVGGTIQANFCPTNLITTTSLNFANAQQLGFVVRGNDANATVTLNNYAIVVNK